MRCQVIYLQIMLIVRGVALNAPSTFNVVTTNTLSWQRMNCLRFTHCGTNSCRRFRSDTLICRITTWGPNKLGVRDLKIFGGGGVLIRRYNLVLHTKSNTCKLTYIQNTKIWSSFGPLLTVCLTCIGIICIISCIFHRVFTYFVK